MTATAKVIDRVRADQQALQEACEDRLLEIVGEGREPNYDDLQLFSLAGWGDKQVSAQVLRANKVHRLLGEAPTAKRLDELRDASAKAASRMESEGAKLREQIAKLTAELDELENDAKNKSERLVRGEKVREALKDPTLLPPWIQDQYNRALRGTNSECRQPLREVEQQLHTLDVLRQIRWTDNSLDNPALNAQLGRIAPSERPANAGEWATFVQQECKAEPELQRLRDDLQASYDGAMAEHVLPLREHYIVLTDG